LATFWMAACSSKRLSSRVRINDWSLSAQKLHGVMRMDLCRVEREQTEGAGVQYRWCLSNAGGMKAVSLQLHVGHAFESTARVNTVHCEWEGEPTLRYSTKRFKKATKCSAFRMFPGIASFNKSSGKTMADSVRVKGAMQMREYEGLSWMYRCPQHHPLNPSDLRQVFGTRNW
jgi:hypothetical protein